MKSLLTNRLAILMVVLTFLLGAGVHQAKAQPHVTVSMQVFYDELTPYGDWIYDGRYGYVWTPYEHGFHPYYTNGYWEMTVYGNTWISSYPWGWAPFHYGRWLYDSYYGWIWVPGYTWAPAWVCWRYGGGFYGWAPLGPNFMITIGFGIYDCPYNWWVFTPQRYIYGPRHHTYYEINDNEGRVRHTEIVNHTRTDQQTNTIYTTGPTVDEARKATGNDIVVRQINDVVTPRDYKVSDERIQLYRPQVAKETPGEKEPQPRQFSKAPRAVGDAQPVQINEDRQSEYRRDIERNNPGGIRTEPVRPAVPREEPVRQQPTVPQTEPVRQQPKDTRPVEIERNQPRQTPVKRDVPVQRTKPTAPPVRTEPRSVPQRLPVEKSTAPSRPGNRR